MYAFEYRQWSYTHKNRKIGANILLVLFAQVRFVILMRETRVSVTLGQWKVHAAVNIHGSMINGTTFEEEWVGGEKSKHTRDNTFSRPRTNFSGSQDRGN